MLYIIVFTKLFEILALQRRFGIRSSPIPECDIFSFKNSINFSVAKFGKTMPPAIQIIINGNPHSLFFLRVRFEAQLQGIVQFHHSFFSAM